MINASQSVAGAHPLLGGMTVEEWELLNKLLKKLEDHREYNERQNRFYESKVRVRAISPLIPDQIRNSVQTAVGFAATVVDVIDERLNWEGWAAPDDQALADELADVVAENDLIEEFHRAFLDALIYGTSFIRTGSGNESKGEPKVLVTAHSPLTTTGTWNPRSRRLDNALTVTFGTKHGVREAVAATMDMIGVSLHLVRAAGKGWTVANRDEHGISRTLVQQIFNRTRASREGGASEITPTIRSHTKTALRTMLSMEANREFYSIPQLILANLDADSFEDVVSGSDDSEGISRIMSAWQTMAGSVLGIPRSDNGDAATATQLQVSSPEPFIRQVRMLAELISGAAGVPLNNFGVVTDNPASADAIRAVDGRLIKKVERKQTSFDTALSGTALDVLAVIHGGAIPTGAKRKITSRWRSAAIPTKAADADYVLKLVSVGVLTPHSEVVMSRLDMSAEDRAILAAERQRAEGMDKVNAVLEAARNRIGTPSPTAAPAAD